MTDKTNFCTICKEIDNIDGIKVESASKIVDYKINIEIKDYLNTNDIPYDHKISHIGVMENCTLVTIKINKEVVA